MEYTLPNPDRILKRYTVDENEEKAITEQWLVISNLLNSLMLDFRLQEIQTSASVTSYIVKMFNSDFVPKVNRIEKALQVLLNQNNIKIDISEAFKIQIPKKNRQVIGLINVLQNAKSEPYYLPMFLGLDDAGNSLVYDLAKAPHLLIGGTTGSGKSVCVKTIIASLLLLESPNEIEMYLIDPKMVEFSKYNGIPHLKRNVITEVNEAADLLNNLVDEMEFRYSCLSDRGYTSIDECRCFKRTIVIIDELADLMLIGGKSIEKPLTRLLQKARAAGIHIILATQNPTAKVIPGIIKANCPSRIAFKTASITDSKIILDYGGADKLLGQGDGLFKAVDNPNFKRFQCAFTSDDEIRQIIEHWKTQAPC